MNNGISTLEIKLIKTNTGVIRVGNTRVSLDSVIIAFQNGSTPEQIVQDYDTLTLPEVYATISYYFQNTDEVNAYLEERDTLFEEMRKTNEARFGLKGIREKLLARRRKVT